MPRAVVLLLAVLAAGCHEYPSGARARCPPVAFDERCAAYADAEVERALRCGEIAPVDAEGLRIVAADWWCGGDRPADAELAGLLAADRIGYDEVEAGCVVERLRDLSCARPMSDRAALLEQLRDALEPATPAGEPCTDSIQCVDSYCPARVCGRTCTPHAATGAGCGDEVPCGPGDACDAGGVCSPLPGLGETCTAGCVDGLACLAPLGGGPNRCFEFVLPGEPCDAYRVCRNGCVDPDPASGIGTCGPPPGEGEACLGFDSCGPGLACDAAGTGTCVAALHAGDACVPEEGWRCLFAPFFTCDPEALRCVPLPGIGEACAGTECRLGACLEGRCAWPEPQADVPCASDWNCGDDRICEAGRCVDGCR